jgi:hypothetical protein
MLRGLMSAGPAVRAVSHSGEEQVRLTILDACLPYRQDDGSYLMRNTFHHVICWR